MDNLDRQAWRGLIQLQVALALLLFLPAGTWRYWQGWLYWSAFGGATVAITRHFLVHDRDLIARRLKAGPTAERERGQKWIQAAASLLFIGFHVVAGLDHRFGWSQLAPWWSFLGGVGVLAGFWIVFLTFQANGHASAVIEVDEDQQVISTGPYALIRHPMYAGALLMLSAGALALGSLPALALTAGLGLAMVFRLLAEERFLAHQLPGYEAYRAKVRWRLLPGIW
jgi:protein-S-isoprenylcysteine O-methyltransferase Ste14